MRLRVVCLCVCLSVRNVYVLLGAVTEWLEYFENNFTAE